MQFVIFHGSFGNPQENWFPYLKENLEKLGQEVLVPTFPVEDWDTMVAKGKGYESTIQNLSSWTDTFEKDVLPKLSQPVIFIGHSISAVFILRLVEKFNLQLDSAIFVSPFLTSLNRWEFNAVNDTFYKKDFDFEKLKQLIPVSWAVYGDDDPYVPQEKFKEWVALVGSKPMSVPNGKHLGSAAGFTEFPLLLDLCKERI